jgi:hypothetical protein
MYSLRVIFGVVLNVAPSAVDRYRNATCLNKSHSLFGYNKQKIPVEQH